MTKHIGNKDRNAEAWKQIEKEGLSVDAQVYGDTAYVGFVDKDRGFHRAFAKKNYSNSLEAERGGRATARAISRETGIPLHPAVPSERLKQVPSYTKNAARLKFEHEQRKQEAERAYFESPKGIFGTAVVALFMMVLMVSGCFFLVWIMSLISPA